MREAEQEQGVETVLEMKRVEGERIAAGTNNEGILLLRGRDIFVGRVETAEMVSTGKALNEWVTNKVSRRSSHSLLHALTVTTVQIIAKAGKEILKRTVVNAYLSAVALPLTVYGWAGTALDNTWQRAVDKARKAGLVLADSLYPEQFQSLGPSSKLLPLSPQYSSPASKAPAPSRSSATPSAHLLFSRPSKHSESPQKSTP